MSTKKNGGGAETAAPDSIADLSTDTILAAWLAHGGIEYATQKLSVLRDLVGERVAAERKKVEEAKAEIAARSEAMEKHFAALGFPGGPPIDEAETAKAKALGVRRIKPTPPPDDATFRAALVQRILVLKRDRPKDDPPTTRGLAKWSGATGQRVEAVLSGAPEVIKTSDGRWLPREA